MQKYLITFEQTTLPTAANADCCADHAVFACSSLSPICDQPLPRLQTLELLCPMALSAQHLALVHSCRIVGWVLSPHSPAAGCPGSITGYHMAIAGCSRGIGVHPKPVLHSDTISSIPGPCPGVRRQPQIFWSHYCASQNKAGIF